MTPTHWNNLVDHALKEHGIKLAHAVMPNDAKKLAALNLLKLLNRLFYISNDRLSAWVKKLITQYPRDKALVKELLQLQQDEIYFVLGIKTNLSQKPIISSDSLLATAFNLLLAQLNKDIAKTGENFKGFHSDLIAMEELRSNLNEKTQIAPLDDFIHAIRDARADLIVTGEVNLEAVNKSQSALTAKLPADLTKKFFSAQQAHNAAPVPSLNTSQSTISQALTNMGFIENLQKHIRSAVNDANKATAEKIEKLNKTILGLETTLSATQSTSNSLINGPDVSIIEALFDDEPTEKESLSQILNDIKLELRSLDQSIMKVLAAKKSPNQSLLNTPRGSTKPENESFSNLERKLEALKAQLTTLTYALNAKQVITDNQADSVRRPPTPTTFSAAPGPGSKT